MHIAFLNSIEKETYGGMEEWVRLAAAGLAQQGHTITLIGRTNSEFLRRAENKNLGIKAFEVDISGDFNPATIATIKKYLKDSSVDIITVNFNKDVRLGGLAARWSKATKVIWSVGLNITKDSMIHKLLTPKLVDKVIVPSQSLKNEITSLGYIAPDITEVIPISIEENVIAINKQISRANVVKKYNINDQNTIAVTSGRFVDQKGHTYLIDAAREIAKKYSKITFLLLGDGPLKSDLETKIREYGLEKYFCFAGMLDDISEELTASDLMIHPSIFEPFGIAILEGMRAGLPIVASRIGGIPEVVEEGYNALLVSAGDSLALSDTVLDLLEQKEKRMQYGLNSRTRFEDKFQMDKMIDKLESVYENVLCEKRVGK